MTFDLMEIEGQIAYAIYTECGIRHGDIYKFCEANGFTLQQFEDFLQHGIDAMTAFRLLDKYYSDHEPEYVKAK